MPSVDQTAKYFDRRATELRRPALVDKWAALEPLFRGLPKGAAILECGAGTGLYTLPLARAGFAVTAIDLSSASLAELVKEADAEKVGANVRTLVGDFSDVAPSRGPVDAATFIKVLHHFPDEASIVQALAVAWDALRPGGRIVIFEPNGWNVLWPVLFSLRGRDAAREERNIKLMKPKLFNAAFAPEARVTRGYRYLIPGSVAVRHDALDRADRALSRVPWLRAGSAFVWYLVEKPGTP